VLNDEIAKDDMSAFLYQKNSIHGLFLIMMGLDNGPFTFAFPLKNNIFVHNNSGLRVLSFKECNNRSGLRGRTVDSLLNCSKIARLLTDCYPGECDILCIYKELVYTA
jgi:hypothetical protein